MLLRPQTITHFEQKYDAFSFVERDYWDNESQDKQFRWGPWLWARNYHNIKEFWQTDSILD